jgi:hypothetical protein
VSSKSVTMEQFAFTVPQAAQLAGLSVRKLWADIARGKLQAVRGTGRTLIARGALLKYLEMDADGNPLPTAGTSA